MTGTAEFSVGLEGMVGWFAQLYDQLEGMSQDFVDFLERDSAQGTDVSVLARRSRSGIKRRVQSFLDQNTSAAGAGLVFTRAQSGLHEGVIEWWERDGLTVTRHSIGTNPRNDRFYDYEQLEWFTTPFRSGRPWITGPYLDYLGADEYVVTLSTRVIAHGKPIGVAGVDIEMKDFERALAPFLALIPGPAALLSPHYSVLLGNSSQFVTGDRIDRISSGFVSTAVDAAGATLYLLHR